MADAADHAAHAGGTPFEEDRPRRHKPSNVPGFLTYIPGFFWIVLVYAVGYYLIKDPRAEFVAFGPVKLSWLELVLFLTAIIACSEILKVSKPGIDNSGEVALMGLMAFVQGILIAVSFYEPKLAVFKTTESMELLVINVVQTLVAYYVNSRSLQRTFAQGPISG